MAIHVRPSAIVSGLVSLLLSQPAAAADPPPRTRPLPPRPPTTAPAVDPVTAAPDEREVLRLTLDLNHPDAARRQAAIEAMKKLGPEYVPILYKLRDDPNPAVAGAVGEVIAAFDWMTKGAIITTVTRGSAAERLGVRLGDVLVKANDFDVNGHLDLGKVPDDGDRTYYFWRNGAIRTVKVPPGRVGIFASNWDVALGGSDQSRGLGAFAADKPDVDEVYRRLKAARAAGMTDSYSTGLLASVAARVFDAALANEAYAAHLTDPDDCSLTHQFSDQNYKGLPFNSPHTAYLLGKYKTRPFS
ncbi:MAG TPA: PDZ domain-containing protein, partial [Tepidisphaeraceae bacterium]|nr:PDZ domain-containing protein [Tepidisphaeraceae bacterium]